MKLIVKIQHSDGGFKVFATVGAALVFWRKCALGPDAKKWSWIWL